MSDSYVPPHPSCFPAHNHSGGYNYSEQISHQTLSCHQCHRAACRGRHRMLRKCGHMLCDECLHTNINYYNSITAPDKNYLAADWNVNYRKDNNDYNNNYNKSYTKSYNNNNKNYQSTYNNDYTNKINVDNTTNINNNFQALNQQEDMDTFMYDQSYWNHHPSPHSSHRSSHHPFHHSFHHGEGDDLMVVCPLCHTKQTIESSQLDKLPSNVASEAIVDRLLRRHNVAMGNVDVIYDVQNFRVDPETGKASFP